MGRLPLPISDYVTDTKTVLDNTLRILQARVSRGESTVRLCRNSCLCGGW